MLQPKYTMHGFSWFDRRGTEGVGFVRALRTLLTNNMPTILPELREAIKSNLKMLLTKHCIGDCTVPFKFLASTYSRHDNRF